ncbi:TPA: tyrosine-type recombinase/integrase [Vibrio vulnificus]|nr:tyrosine-type recombinase/integrase [Vibrio alginolyticus]HDY7461375.1 tyrosine-type recombinase/integrase [Vibrio vulnificus]HDY8211290.1 tyrosine-type recombinase/integrase [Vibrio vulnificus]
MTTKSIKIHDGLSIRKLPQSKNYSVYIKFDGHKKRQFSLKTSDLDEAIAKAKAEYQFNKMMLERGLPIQQPKQRLTVHKLCNELINEFEQLQNAVEIRETKKVVKGKEKYATQIRYWKRFIEYYPDNLLISDLTFDEVQSYFLSLETSFSKNTFGKYKFCFKKLFERALDKKVITIDQTFDINKINVEFANCEARNAFNENELSILFNEIMLRKKVGKAKHTDKLFFAYLNWLNFTGMRTGDECYELQWKDFELNNNGDLYCIVNGGKTANYKKNKRKVVLDTMAVNSLLISANEKYKDLVKGLDEYETIELLSRIKSKDFVFSTKYTDRPTYNKIFNELIEDLQSRHLLTTSKNFTLYSLRHSYITRCIENNVPLSLIAEVCGTSLKMIEDHYSHIETMSKSSRKHLLTHKVIQEEENKKRQKLTEQDIQDQKNELLDFLENQDLTNSHQK